MGSESGFQLLTALLLGGQFHERQCVESWALCESVCTLLSLRDAVKGRC